MPVLEVPAGGEGWRVGIPNLLKQEEPEEDEDVFFYVISQDFWSKLIMNVASNNHIILILYE